MDTAHKHQLAVIFVPSILFSIVAVGAFCIWAFGGGVLKGNEMAIDTACSIIFLGLGGLALHPYSGIQSRTKMAYSFAAGFALYSVIWMFVWFSFRNTFGEILGSFVGISAMMFVFKKLLNLSPPLIALIAIVFLWHTLGYYAGGYAYKMIPASDLFADNSATVAKLIWGACYGFGMGLGITQAIQLSRKI